MTSHFYPNYVIDILLAFAFIKLMVALPGTLWVHHATLLVALSPLAKLQGSAID
jgi:hypothetical protein